MGCTLLYWSDRHAATIIEVINERRIVVQRDNAVRTDNNGMSESQEYTFTPNPEAAREEFTLRKNGRRVRKGESINGNALAIGYRKEFYDFSR